jgi:hypothetical protein
MTQSIQFLHIPKTGGTAFKNAFKGKKGNLVLNGHGVTFRDIVEMPSSQCIFFIRDIVTRYVSGFNSRLRKGQPYTNAGWDEGERVAFKYFRTPNELAEALTDDRIEIRRLAECSMANIWHTRFPLHFWLHSVEFLEKHKRQILFIGRQEHMQEDFQRFVQLLFGEECFSLPDDDVSSHKTPEGFSIFMSEKGKENILNWYKSDLDLIKWCDEFRNSMH